MTKSKHRPRWIAGPIRYSASSNFIGGEERLTSIGFDFVACTRGGQLRRYRLLYNVRTRVFTGNTQLITKEDAAHEAQLLALYQPIGVPRDTLPDGGVAVALKAMLTAADLADLAAASIKNRDLFSKGDE